VTGDTGEGYDLMVRAECYAASRPQEGRSTNEDAFLIGRGPIPYAALCDGAGNAQLAAKRALTLFDKLVQQATPEQVTDERTWSNWIKLLDSALLGGTQSTFVGVALLDGIGIGAAAGDSRAYLIDREGECRNLTEGARKYRLGSGDATAFAIRQPLGHGDILLLLSDGAWTPLGPYLLKKTVMGTRARHFSEVPQAVLDAAGRTGRMDDMTAIAVRVVR
jgi:serine/threonine protein phosphatase PrpC